MMDGQNQKIPAINKLTCYLEKFDIENPEGPLTLSDNEFEDTVSLDTGVTAINKSNKQPYNEETVHNESIII